MASTSLATLDYEAPPRRYVGMPRGSFKGRLGFASCMCWGVSMACVAMTFFIAAAKGTSRGSVFFTAVLGMWWLARGASIVGKFIGVLGMAPFGRRAEFALTGLVLNGLSCLCPLLLYFLGIYPIC